LDQPGKKIMATLYRAGDALTMFRTERVIGRNQEMVYDAASQAHH
jgi:hypothetical protein